MNLWSKNLILTALLTGATIQSSEAERKKDAAQQQLDLQLYSAVRKGEIDSVKTLLERNANPNAIVDGTSIFSKSVSMVLPNFPTPTLLLLNHNANPHITFYIPGVGHDHSPLHYLHSALNIKKRDKENRQCCSQIMELAKLLLQHGCNINQNCTEMGSSEPLCCNMDSLLIKATKKNLPEFVTLYLANGAYTELADADGGIFRDHADDKPKILQIYKEHVDTVRRKISDASKLPTVLTQLCVSYLHLPDRDYRQQRAECIGTTIPQLTHAQDFREHETDLTACIAEYV